MNTLSRKNVEVRFWLLVLGILILLNATTSIGVASFQTQEVTIEVFAAQDWQNTGVSVQPGDTLTIQYISGLWSPWPDGYYDGLGLGWDHPDRTTNNVMVGVPHASLIGGFESGTLFFVGNGISQPVGESGYVFLRINDTVLGDNSNSLTVRVQVTPSAPPPTPVPPPPTPRPAQISFTVNPDVIVRGQCSTLRWDVENVLVGHLARV